MSRDYTQSHRTNWNAKFLLTSSNSDYTLLETIINQIWLAMNTKTKLVHVLHALLHMCVPEYTLLAVKNINSSTSGGVCITVSLKLIRIQLQLTLTLSRFFWLVRS